MFSLALATNRYGLRRRVGGGLRVLAYAVVVSVGLGAWSYRSAKAEIGRSSMVIGRDLAKVADLLAEPRHVVINGEQISAATTLSAQSTSEVLDRFEEHCRESPGALGDAWSNLAALDGARQAMVGTSPIRSAGVVRHEKDNEGVVLCLTKGANTPATFAEAATAFQQTYDLGALGKLRYVYARPDGDKTRVLTLWTEDSFRFERLFPASGDAPGSDPEVLGAPPDAVRLLSIRIADTPFAVFVYQSTRSPDSIVKYYDDRMGSKDWTVLTPPGGPEAGRHGYVKNGVVFTASAIRDEQGMSLVSIGEMADAAR